MRTFTLLSLCVLLAPALHAAEPTGPVFPGWPVTVDCKGDRQFRTGMDAMQKSKKPGVAYIHASPPAKGNKPLTPQDEQRRALEVKYFKLFCEAVGKDAPLTAQLTKDYVVFVGAIGNRHLVSRAVSPDFCALAVYNYVPEGNRIITVHTFETPPTVPQFKAVLAQIGPLTEKLLAEEKKAEDARRAALVKKLEEEQKTKGGGVLGLQNASPPKQEKPAKTVEFEEEDE